MNRFKTSLAQTENRVEDKPEIVSHISSAQDRTIKPVENRPIAAAHDIFITAPKKRGHDLTVYLTNEVWEAVNNLSKQLEIGKSVIVGRALREVLKIK